MINPRLHKQLFLDDEAIETKYGLRRTLNKPERAGPVMRPDQSLGQVSLLTSSSPQWNPEQGLWELWYRSGYRAVDSGGEPDARASEEPDPLVSFTHYATSTDGVNWDRRNLGLQEWNGSKDNNIVPSANGRTLSHILRDEREDDPDRRYKALFTNRGNARYPAVSSNGFDWTFIDVPPIPSDDTSGLVYDSIHDRFVATVKLPTKWGRSVWLSTSGDFIDWTEPELIFHSDEIDLNNARRRIRKVVDDPSYLTPPIVRRDDQTAQVYLMPLMPYEGLYIAFPMLLNTAGALPVPPGNHNGINQTELAVSRDLHDWKRVANRDLFLEVLPWDGEVYDTTQVPVSGPPIVREDLGEIWVYYNACRFRSWSYQHDESYAPYFRDLNCLSLAKVRLDGFVSLDAEDKGTMLTSPFVLDGDVYVNADAQNGQLKAELVDATTMDPLPGYSLTDCDPVTVDDLSHKLTWRESTAPRREQPVRLRFELTQTKLYAFWLNGRG